MSGKNIGKNCAVFKFCTGDNFIDCAGCELEKKTEEEIKPEVEYVSRLEFLELKENFISLQTRMIGLQTQLIETLELLTKEK